MPQVHNKSHSMNMDSSAFNKNSRFMAALNFTEQSMRRVNVLNSLDKHLCRIKMNYYDRSLKFTERKLERVRVRLVDSLNKRLAYKIVLKKHSISNARDYKKALDGKYTYGALYNEVKEVVNYMKPEVLRERRAKALVDMHRKRYHDLINENRAALDVLCPPKKIWEPVDFSKFGKKGDESEEEETQPSPELPPIERRNKNSLAGLRRRIITIDDSKPNSPMKSPLKTPTLSKPPSSNSLMGGKRQGITMSMMKKQKSFLSNKERTATLDAIDVKNKAPEEAEKEVDTSQKVNSKGNTNIDANNNDILVSANKTTSETTEAVTVPQNQISAKTKRRKSSLLPPIKQNEQGKGIHPDEIKNSPVLSTGKPVKLPVLKMNTNRKEIKVH